MIRQSIDVPFNPDLVARIVKVADNAVKHVSDTQVVLQSALGINVLSKVYHEQPAETVQEGEEPQFAAHLIWQHDDAMAFFSYTIQVLCQSKEELEQAWKAILDKLTTGACEFDGETPVYQEGPGMTVEEFTNQVKAIRENAPVPFTEVKEATEVKAVEVAANGETTHE